MDLEDAAALSVCARCEKQRLEGQHERIWLVASGRWCLAMRRSQQERQRQKHVRKEGARARAGTPCVLLTAARVSSITRHRAAVLRVMQGEARAARAGEALCSCRVLLLLRRRSARQDWVLLGVAVLSLLFTD